MFQLLSTASMDGWTMWDIVNQEDRFQMLRRGNVLGEHSRRGRGGGVERETEGEGVGGRRTFRGNCHGGGQVEEVRGDT